MCAKTESEAPALSLRTMVAARWSEAWDLEPLGRECQVREDEMIRPFLRLPPDRPSPVEGQLAAVIGGRVQGEDVDVQASKVAIHHGLPRGPPSEWTRSAGGSLSLRLPTP